MDYKHSLDYMSRQKVVIEALVQWHGRLPVEDAIYVASVWSFATIIFLPKSWGPDLSLNSKGKEMLLLISLHDYALTNCAW